MKQLTLIQGIYRRARVKFNRRSPGNMKRRTKALVTAMSALLVEENND